MDVESVSGTTTYCLQKSANLKTFLGLEVRFGKGTLLLYCFVNARRSCISSFMVISLFNFRRPSLSKGLFAGAMGGLAGGLVKAAAEVIYPPRVQGQTSPPVILMQRTVGRPLSSRQQKIAESSVHFAFSAAVGALYGALAECWPDATAGQGTAFALVLLGATHESALPALHLAEPARRQSKREQLSELVTHLVFGVTAEQLQRRIRAWM